MTECVRAATGKTSSIRSSITPALLSVPTRDIGRFAPSISLAATLNAPTHWCRGNPHGPPNLFSRGPAAMAAPGDFSKHGLNGRISFDHCCPHRGNEFFPGLSHFFVSGLNAWVLHGFLPCRF